MTLSLLKQKLFSKKGFTLLELLVVISIIGILIAMGAVSYTAAQQKARNARRRGDIQAWSAALEQYYSSQTNPQYPAAGCDPTSVYLPGGRPKDPKTGVVYANNCPAAPAATYCLCATLEPAGASDGNSTATADATCSGLGAAGTLSYFCVKNQQ